MLLSMAKFSVNLPEPIYQSLMQWAEHEGRTKGNLAAFLLEAAVRLRYPREHPPTFEAYPPGMATEAHTATKDTGVLQRAMEGDKEAIAQLKGIVEVLSRQE